MREQFDKQLARLRQELVAIYTEIDLQLHKAVDSLVEGDKAKAREVKKATRAIDSRCADLEDRVYNLIVLQNPVASDMRLLQFVIYVNFNLARMSNHVRNIAKTTKRCVGREIPRQMLDLLASQAHLVYRVLGTTVEAIVDNDIAEAAELPEFDRPVDDLYKSFYSSFSHLGPDDDIDAVSRVMMAARMLERISDNSVEVGERLVFLLTGSRAELAVLADMDEEELEDLYASQNAAFTMGADKIETVVNQIPEIEVGTSTNPILDDEEIAGNLAQALEMAANAAARAKEEKARRKSQKADDAS
ncbi:MAG: phosphate uptake regulator PhoU [Atopobiaceae bacterium]|nr:phosphate uptake regulator PhoU [Atopobiaceae bacterium]